MGFNEFNDNKYKYFIIIISIILVIIGIILIFYICRPKNITNNIPKKIWTYWDNSNNIPKTVKMCMESWKKYNPNYTITLLTKDNYQEYGNIPKEISEHPNFNDFPARFADLVRLYVLEKHGGVWIDSSILVNSSLDDWLFPRYGEFSGFYIDGFTTKKEYPVIENWFFACNKESKFMKLWKDEFIELSKFPDVKSYIEAKKEQVDFQKISDPHYLAMHIGAQKVLQIDKYPIKNLILRKAEDGPFKYLVDSQWDSAKGLEIACNNKSYHKPIMKMRGLERRILEEKIDNELSLEKCNWL
jgi:hypothetical protein